MRNVPAGSILFFQQQPERCHDKDIPAYPQQDEGNFRKGDAGNDTEMGKAEHAKGDADEECPDLRFSAVYELPEYEDYNT
jgi:hypothetical protein